MTRLWSVNAIGTEGVRTCFRFDLSPVVVDAPHVPHCGGGAGWTPVAQARALAETLARMPADERGIDLNNTLIPCCLYKPRDGKAFARREVVVEGCARGGLLVDAPWETSEGSLPSQVEQLSWLVQELARAGISAVDGGIAMIWCGEPEGFGTDFLDPGVIVDVISDPRWRAREPRESWDIDPRMITDWTLDFARSLKWKRAMDRALETIRVKSLRGLLRTAGLVPKVRSWGGGPVVASPYINVGAARVPLLGGNGEPLRNMGAIDNHRTMTGYLFQAGSRFDPARTFQLAAEVLTRTSGQNAAHKLNTGGYGAALCADLCTMAADLGHRDLILWTNPGDQAGMRAVSAAGVGLQRRMDELMSAGAEFAGDGSVR